MLSLNGIHIDLAIEKNGERDYMMKKESNNQKERNVGIDLLRLIAMFFVVLLHCFNHGGILANVSFPSSQYKLAWLINIIAYCAVDLFALISGFVSYRAEEKKLNYAHYLCLWVQVVFYGVLVTLCVDWINPTIVSRKDYLMALFPVTNDLYWYFTAYTGLIVIMPLLNKGIRNCSNKMMKKLFLMILVVFSFFATISKRFDLSKGYSFIWIVLLYVLGATIKKCEIGKKLKNYQIIIGICLLYLITYLYKIYGFKTTFLSVKITKNLLISYTSPTIIGVAILSILLFSRIKMNRLGNKIVLFAAPSAFAIYLLNNHWFIWKYVMKNLFVTIANQSVLKILIYPIGFSILFVVASILIDRLRILLFKVGRVKVWTNKIVDGLNKAITKIIELL